MAILFDDINCLSDGALGVNGNDLRARDHDVSDAAVGDFKHAADHIFRVFVDDIVLACLLDDFCKLALRSR